MKRLVIAITSLLLIACSKEPLISSGTVTRKDHQPEKKWVQIILIPIIRPVGKTTITTFIPVPIFHRRREQWTVVIEGWTGSDTERLRKQRTLYVSRETYERTAIGDIYTVQAADRNEPFIEKHRASHEEKLVYGVQSANPR